MNSSIIAGDYIYLVCIGNSKIIDKMAKGLNEKGQKYIKHDLNVPCVEMIDDDIIKNLILNENTNNNKHIIFDEGIEKAQCYIYADVNDNNLHTNKNLFMLMTLTETKTNIKISYPILQVDNEDNSEKIINKWLSLNKLNEYIDTITIRWINIVGKINDIMVFVGYIE